jgi:hypothetical protein
MTTWLSYMGWLTAVAALGYAIYFISRRVRGAGLGSARERGSLNEREAALVAQARADALGARAVAPPARDAATETPHGRVQLAAPGGLMKSAGDPRVRKAFAQAMKEVDTKTYDSGLWAMALVDCNGDEKMARLAYMKARAADLVCADAKAAEQPPVQPPRDAS